MKKDGAYWQARIRKARARWLRGEITLEELYAIVDEYIAALKEYRRRTGKKFRIPSRGYILRAF